MLSTLATRSAMRFSVLVVAAAKSTLPRALGATRSMTLGDTFGKKASDYCVCVCVGAIFIEMT